MRTLVETLTNLHIFFDLLQWLPQKYHMSTRKRNENQRYKELGEKVIIDSVASYVHDTANRKRG